VITDVAECDFYHTLDLPKYGLIPGEWDLRGRVREYLGGQNLAGKRVLEIGTASGFLCMAMEAMGAEVVAYDLSEDYSWDVVPYAGFPSGFESDRKRHLRRLNNGWWLNHGANQAKARVVYGTVYDIPVSIGPVQVATFGAILQHLRDPFQAMYQASRLVEDTIIVIDPPPPGYWLGRRYREWYARLWNKAPFLRKSMASWPRVESLSFRPEPSVGEPKETWWLLTPELVQRYLAVLGFEQSTVTFHHQRCSGQEVEMFTVVAYRTQPRPPID
jgi:hypothetical protein